MKTNFYLTMARVLTLGIVVLIMGSIASGQIPVLNNISPSTVEIGNDGLTMILNGENFLTTSIVRFNGSDLMTTFVSESELEASLTKSELSLIGTFEVVVANPSPNGGISAVKQFTVTGTSQQITSIYPTTKLYGTSNLSLAINGENFNQNTVVRFNGSNRSTRFVSTNSLIAELYPSDVFEVGVFSINVYNFGAGGGISNSIDISIVYAQPLMSSISPSNKVVGDTQFTMTVKGSGFAPVSKVYMNHHLLPTTFINQSTLLADVAANYMVEPFEHSVYVYTPSPGGGSSESKIFTVDSMALQITKISPPRLKVGSAGFLMKIEGVNFTPTTIGKFNGSYRRTTFISEKLIYINILSDDIKHVGIYSISVADQSNKIESNIMTLTVYSTKSTRENDSDIRAANSMEPDDFLLAQNYPNPFNPSTMINFILRNMSTVTIDVYNSLGQKVATLLDGKELSAGEQTFQFDAANLASGEYFYHIIVNENEGGNFSSIKKMILIK
ncbi:MAG: T9SS type A sorting domain-containing protein [Ignavibacteriales bacterium]|nr:T9SS type A sorting domain-containing protein [Ignavibacteriales bacterium]